MRRVVAAGLGCRWRCDDADAGFDIPCREDEEARRERNCDGKGKPVVVGGVPFDRCPAAWRMAHPAEQALWETWVDCCGGVIGDGQGGVNAVRFLPFPGSVADQPAAWLTAFRIFAGEVQRYLNESVPATTEGYTPPTHD